MMEQRRVLDCIGERPVAQGVLRQDARQSTRHLRLGSVLFGPRRTGLALNKAGIFDIGFSEILHFPLLQWEEKTKISS